MDFGKFKYEQNKKQQKARRKQHVTHLKEVKLRPKIEEHDYNFKVEHGRRFLELHDKVKFTVMFRGREMAHPEAGTRLLEKVIKDLELLPTFPFHYKYLRNAVRGDYLNVFVTFDLTVRRLGESVFTTSLGLDPNMKRMDEVVNPPDFLTGAMANLSGQAADPFKIPPGTATQHEGKP